MPTSVPTSDALCRRSSTGTKTSSLGVGHSTAQCTPTPARFRSEHEVPRASGYRSEATIQHRHRCSKPSRLKRRLTHLVPFRSEFLRDARYHTAARTRALCRERFARSSSRQLDTPDRQPATRLSKRSTRSRFDYRSPTTAASFALHGARPTSAPELASRIGVIFQPETR